MRWRPRLVLTVLLIVGVALSGCSDDAPADAQTGTGTDETDVDAIGSGTWNYTTGHAAGEAVSTVLDGRLTADEVQLLLYRFDSPVGGSCCSYDSVDATGLFTTDQMVHMRINLTWTNTPENQVNLYLAPCVPFYCTGGQDGDGQPPSAGEQTESLEFVTGGVGWEDEYFLRLRYENPVVTTGLSYSMEVTVTPFEDALVLFDPYEVTVPEGGTLSARLMAPPSEDEAMVGLTLYDDTDRPIAFERLEGRHGDTFDLGVGNGTFVVVPMTWSNAHVRLQADVLLADGDQQLQRLEEDGEYIEVESISDPQARSGTFELEAPAGTLGPFPGFTHASPGAHAAGVASEGFRGGIHSSSGMLSYAQDGQLGTRDPVVGDLCISCFSGGAWNPENIVDDDGVYELRWENEEQTGDILVWSPWYVR